MPPKPTVTQTVTPASRKRKLPSTTEEEAATYAEIGLRQLTAEQKTIYEAVAVEEIAKSYFKDGKASLHGVSWSIMQHACMQPTNTCFVVMCRLVPTMWIGALLMPASRRLSSNTRYF